MFKFTKSENQIHLGGTPITSMLSIEDTQMFQAAFLGRCMTLFGEPNEVGDDYEELYSYHIIAEDEKGNEVSLEVYFGSGGPSVGYGDSEIEREAAVELARTILQAEPMDCKIKSRYDDTSVRIIMGVKDGESFYETLFPGMTEDMTDDEKEEYLKKLFGVRNEL